MKSIKLNKTILFALVGGLLPLLFVYIVSYNQITFIGSRTILGIALAILIVICAATVGFRFKPLSKQEKIINVIVGTAIYTIIYFLFLNLIIKPEDTNLLNVILTGYYGVIASIISIVLRGEEKEEVVQEHKYFKEKKKK